MGGETNITPSEAGSNKHDSFIPQIRKSVNPQSDVVSNKTAPMSPTAGC